MAVEDGVPVGFYVEAIFFFIGGCFSAFIFESSLCEASMMFLEAVHELADHLPGFLRIGSEVFLLTFFGEVELPLPFGSSFFFEEVSSGFFEGLLEIRSPFLHEVFLRFIPF